MSEALERLFALRPQLSAVVTAGEALGLAPGHLLHAGPPLRDPRRPPPVLRSSILVTSVHEGWADDFESADALLASGDIVLSPAQDRGCVTPLAAVISARTPLFELTDGDAVAEERQRSWAPVSTTGGPDTRAGCRDAGVAARLRHRDEVIAPALQQLLATRGPLPLWPLAAHGLARGDDLHSRTAAANQAFVDALRAEGAGVVAGEIEATPLFFLTLWMAACSLMLRAAEKSDLPTLVTRAGGNGERFGIALAASPERWITTDATPPQGRLLAHLPADTAVAGAIGDSAVIDMLGLGAQRLALAPEPLEALGPFLPDDHATLARRLLSASHPDIAPPWPLGLDARRVVEENAAPLVVLAMLAADGLGGIVGRGVYHPPVALFRRALQVGDS